MKLFFLLLMLNGYLYSQENYNLYHEKINKAEKFYFIENKIDSALYYYDKAFDEYSFNFLRDSSWIFAEESFNIFKCSTFV